ncbi:MAG: enoyl-[acyl-carrier protein] reductase [Chloroflexota bacterium]|jgi:NAD(P)H-dependent flavin oxidoreductase YrpB (nitropropane dioxygenase family)|nr:enoyl-[acyl-carrier protein] reductase [Chloroflexota bacterium]
MSRLQTPVCDLLGIQLPIVQAGMSTYTTPELVAAVSNAGGLGIIGGLGRKPDDLREEIRKVRELTSRPFGVNHVISQLDPAAIEVTLELRVPVLALAWGKADEIVRRAHEAGIKVIHQVNTPEEAGRAAADGADVIVAQGAEGGGHVGAMSTLPLVPQVVDVVNGVPVLAAGGIADGRGVAAALMLGAQGAFIGTRFLATPEASGRGHSKDVILNALGSQTVASKFFDDVLGLRWPGALVRSIRNPLLDRWAQRQQDWALAADQIRPSLEAALAAGDFVLAGESAGLIHDIVPAGELVARIAREAEALLG